MGGAGSFWPEQWAAFAGMIPEAERGDLIAAYHRRLFSGDQNEQIRFARAWAGWEASLAVLDPGEARGYPAAGYALAFARLENHYFVNGGFLEADDQVMRDMPRIAHIPGTIVQGRYDMICPPHTAYSVHAAWPASTLRMVATAGHALSEPGITAELVAATDRLRA